MHHSVTLGGIHHQVANLHLMYKAVQLTRVVRDRTGFLVGVYLRNLGLERLTIRLELGQIANLIPPERNEILLQEEGIGITGPSTMNAPDIGVVSAHKSSPLKARSRIAGSRASS